MTHEARFLAAVREHADTLYRICHAYGRDDAERRDLYQEVLIHLWRGLRGFRGDSALATWMYRVAVNTCLGRRRSETRRERRFLQAGDELLAATPDPGAIRVATDANLERLYACIARLGPIDRVLVSLYLEELEFAQIAQVLGLTEGNVRVRLHRARERLKQLWEEGAR